MSPGTGKVCKFGIYTLPGFCHQCDVGVARVEGDLKTRGWDSNIYFIVGRMSTLLFNGQCVTA